MRRKRPIGAGFGFSNEKFMQLLSSSSGISPVGVLGRETPLDLSGPEAAAWSLLIREVFSKYDDGKPSEDKEKNTWKRFHEAERNCLDANKRISKTFQYSKFWRSVKMRIHDTLGIFDWDECYRFFSFGPGSTTRLPRRMAAAAYKYSGQPESTLGNSILASCAIRMSPLWTHNVLSTGEGSGDLVKIVPGNRVIVVPKNFKTDRTIAKEPCMNIYIQKGIGRVIRNRLARVGIDLRDQTANQKGALLGSLTGELATVDLSMASDTLAYELVSFLLPNDWFYALEQSRSPVGVLASGERISYQKFSSMGNGYTFELETLIFWAITQQVCCWNINETDSRVLVYGDDIIVPTDSYEQLTDRLREAGFTPNPSKSFGSGPYRESCGKHYFQGIDITPFYVRRPVTKLDKLFLVHNNVYRWCERVGADLSSMLTTLKAMAPQAWRKPRLPDGFGDGAFIGPVDELRLDNHPYGWESWIVKCLAVQQQLVHDDLPVGQMIASLRQLSTDRFDCRYLSGFRESVSGLPVREGKYRCVTISIPRRALDG